MKAIETRYNGHRFRSRTEARWAVLFDHLGVKYEYEAEGFELGGYRYLPDFYLPKEDCFVEVKGEALDDSWRKPALLAHATMKPVYVLSGQPGFHTVTLMAPHRQPPIKAEDVEAWLALAPDDLVRNITEYALDVAQIKTSGTTMLVGLHGTLVSRDFIALDYCPYSDRLAEWRATVHVDHGHVHRHEPTGAWSPGWAAETYVDCRPIGLSHAEYNGLVESEVYEYPDGFDEQEARISVHFQAAIKAARSARFEFGESGAG